LVFPAAEREIFKMEFWNRYTLGERERRELGQGGDWNGGRRLGGGERVR